MNEIESCDKQARAVGAWFDRLAEHTPSMPGGATGGDAPATFH
jgi:hypothetical protein